MKFHQEISVKKIIGALAMMIIMFYGVFSYISFKEFVNNTNIASIREIYIPLLKYKFSHLAAYTLASPLSVFGEKNDTPGAFPATNESSGGNSIPILLYHSIVSKADEDSVTLKNFREQMFALKEAGYETVFMEDFYEFKRGRKELPARSIMITFDDGRKDSYYPTHAILKALKYHAVMFAIQKYSFLEKSKYYLTEAELRGMAKTNTWEIQSHGNEAHDLQIINAAGEKGHFYSNRLWLPNENRLETPEEMRLRIRKDVVEAKEALGKISGRNIIGFAFPFGDFGENSENFPEAEDMIVAEASAPYQLAFYQVQTGKRFTQSYPEKGSQFLIKRITVDPSWTANDLIQVLEKGGVKALPYSDTFEKDMGWINTRWGSLEFEAGTMTLSAANNGTGNAAILDGTRLWENYRLEAEVAWPYGSNIYLWTRFADDDNHAACNFGKSLIHIEQTLRGETKVIKGITHTLNFPSGNFTIAMEVVGRHVTCFMNGEKIIESEFLDPDLDKGGIGLKTWDPSIDHSLLEVKKINVVPLPRES